MIWLHSVTKVVGQGMVRKTVIDGVDWTIEPHTSYVILGQRGAGKSVLLELISGGLTPTLGWVERRAMVSPLQNLLRLAGPFTTAKHLAEQLAFLHKTDVDSLVDFIYDFADFDEMDFPVRRLPPLSRQKLALALFYGLRCDLYLFDGRFESRVKGMHERCFAALKKRREQSSMIFTTSSSRLAQKFGGVPLVLFRGKLMPFKSLDEAINVFERLPVEIPANEALQKRAALWARDNGPP